MGYTPTPSLNFRNQKVRRSATTAVYELTRVARTKFSRAELLHNHSSYAVALCTELHRQDHCYWLPFLPLLTESDVDFQLTSHSFPTEVNLNSPYPPSLSIAILRTARKSNHRTQSPPSAAAVYIARVTSRIRSRIEQRSHHARHAYLLQLSTLCDRLRIGCFSALVTSPLSSVVAAETKHLDVEKGGKKIALKTRAIRVDNDDQGKKKFVFSI